MADLHGERSAITERFECSEVREPVKGASFDRRLERERYAPEGWYKRQRLRRSS